MFSRKETWEDHSPWVLVRGGNSFSRRVTGRPNDGGARSACKERTGERFLISHEET